MPSTRSLAVRREQALAEQLTELVLGQGAQAATLMTSSSSSRVTNTASPAVPRRWRMGDEPRGAQPAAMFTSFGPIRTTSREYGERHAFTHYGARLRRRLEGE